MRPLEVLRKTREGIPLGEEELRSFVRGVTTGEVADAQVGAWLMAVFCRGLSPRETVALARAMAGSGARADLSSIPGVKTDKHSTGGVGDKVSIPLAPLVAACGVPVPMVSGRGLGHTGGTLDKLESIPGFRTRLSLAEFVETLRRTGACLVGQTDDLAPADRRLYALRDFTATVESLPLIASSILSKKVAEGTDALVLDVKVGSGSFLKDVERCRLLARTLVEVGTGLGLRTSALLTDMDQPLGLAVGNALEVAEAIACLRGEGPEDLRALVVELGAEMLRLAGRAEGLDAGREAIATAMRSGSGLAKFREIVEAQGGDPSVVDQPARLPAAPSRAEFRVERSGIVVGIDAEKVGLAAMALGAGRKRPDDPIDPGAGLLLRKKVGDRVARGEALAEMRHGAGAPFEEARALLEAAFRIGTEPPRPRPLVLERIEPP